MTTLYNDYLTAYNVYLNARDNNLSMDGLLDMSNIKFGVLLVDDEYIPNPMDKPWDIVGYIIYNPNALFNDILLTCGMSEIMSQMKAAILEDATKNLNLVNEKYKEAFEIVPGPLDFNQNVWSKLKDLGAKYLITYSTELNICCFAEEIDTM